MSCLEVCMLEISIFKFKFMFRERILNKYFKITTVQMFESVAMLRLSYFTGNFVSVCWFQFQHRML